MLRYLRGVYPGRTSPCTPVSCARLVKPADLAFHIKEAVDVAARQTHRSRVDLLHEDDWQRTARTMAVRETAVEVPSQQRPDPRSASAPTTPSRTTRLRRPSRAGTDDPGVSRIDISHEVPVMPPTRTRLSYPD
ncbi:hypothetical protein GCM10023238_15020 [Streptomyces heliomycini]